VDAEITIWGLIVALAIFTIGGVAMFVLALRPDRSTAGEPGQGPKARDAERGFRAGVHRYVGPVTPDLALLSPARRVLLEFVGAFCGFPGFGWLMSTRVAIGLTLLCLGPALVYGAIPVALAFSGHLSDGPYVAIAYLPTLAVVSATCLALAEFKAWVRG
jgi:hypothetical protein